ncbi:hypothetical protein ASZ90_000093 [hydrocarbon metagenome]|uniref:Phage terminase, large subunit n=1 Tax=hydrocarbon metagenome TaxID=938273 RepID=A0A0W8GA63_9ZZZZ
MPKPAKKVREDRNAAIIARWNAPGAEGFFNWIDDIKPQVVHSDNRYRPVSLEDWQRDILADALAVDTMGLFKHSLALTRMPRRHSKSTLWALVVLWLSTSRENWTITLLGNSEEHSTRTQFKPIRRIIQHTKALAALIPSEAMLKFSITVPHTESTIQGGASGMSTAFGDRVNVLWASDFHQVDQNVFDALSGSLLDSEGTLTLIDANADPEGGPVHALEALAETDPKIFCRAVEYRDFKDYCRRAPAWIDRAKAKQLQRTQLDMAFQRDILGKRSAAKNALFLPETITLCRCELPHPFPADRIAELVANRRYCVGAGLDRAKKLFGGDASVWTTTLKTTSEGGEPEYVVLRQHVFELNTAAAIKKVITADHKAYKLDAVTLEAYEVADLEPWLVDQKIPVEVVSAHAKNQNLSFVELHNVAKEGRLRFSMDLEQLATEMKTFIYEEARDGKYSFGHSSQKFHDDTVYSLNWSVFATRARVLQVYALARLVCASKSQHRSLCFLMGGQMELPCKHDCRAWHEVSEMHRAYCRLRDDPLSLSEFFSTYVKVTGPRVYQAA